MPPVYDRFGNPTPHLANSDEYRENWDRIFGKKKVKCDKCQNKVPVDDADYADHSCNGAIFFCKECTDRDA